MSKEVYGTKSYNLGEAEVVTSAATESLSTELVS